MLPSGFALLGAQPAQPDTSQRSLLNFGTVVRREAGSELSDADRELLSSTFVSTCPPALAVTAEPVEPEEPVAKKSRRQELGDLVTVTFVGGLVQGTAARDARDPCVMAGTAHTPKECVLVTFGVQKRSKEWIDGVLASKGVWDDGDDGTKAYTKLAASEKQLAVEMFDSAYSTLGSVRLAEAAVKQYSRFASVCKRSIDDWRKQLARAPADSTATQAKHGRPPLVTQELRDGIKAEVRSAALHRGTLLTTLTTRLRLAPGLQIKSMVDNNLAVDHSVVKSAAIAYLTIHAQHVLPEGGGNFKAGRSWCNELLLEMGLTYRKCTTQSSKVPDDWEHKGTKLGLQARPYHKWAAAKRVQECTCVFVCLLCTRMLLTQQPTVQITFLADLYKIPADLVLNSDQTGLPLTPSSDYNRAMKGAKEVSCAGWGDKRQITVTPTTSAAGHMLPPQVRILCCSVCALCI
jgi:hypothetical protein